MLTLSVVGTCTFAPLSASVRAKSSDAGPWYRQPSTCARVIGMRRLAPTHAAIRSMSCMGSAVEGSAARIAGRVYGSISA